MKVNKSVLLTKGDKLSFGFDLTKVDKENRIVSGFATLDNIDRQGDRIEHSANVNAFKRFRKNLREMHSNIAAGRVVDFEEKSFYDPESGQNYTGIYVHAYVSKGAPSTWEKVLDGTLTGFSIGGNINDSYVEFDKSVGDSVRVIKDYDLVELSLVDSPANQLANIFSVQKSEEAEFVKGMASTVNVRNAFYCENDEIAQDSDKELEDCPVCGDTMKNIGWYESTEEDGDQDFRNLVDKFLSSQNEQGGVTKMANENENVESTEVTEQPVEAEPTTQEEGAEEGANENVEEGSEVVTTEAVSDEQDIEKMLDEIKDQLVKNHERSSETLSEIESRVEELKKSSDERFAEFDKKFSEFQETRKALEDKVGGLEKTLESINKSSAVKKSGEVENTETTVSASEGSVFKGAFTRNL